MTTSPKTIFLNVSYLPGLELTDWERTLLPDAVGLEAHGAHIEGRAFHRVGESEEVICLDSEDSATVTGVFT